LGGPSPLRLLLDTHIFLWALLEPERLGAAVAAVLTDAGNQLWLSPVSIWEVLVLADKGRVLLEPDPIAWVRRALRAAPLREAPLTHEVAIRSRQVELPHADPADRFLVATAQVYELTLVTADRRLLGLRGVGLLPGS
jgi:PIN domain nuclease of toxin-antitoxin system